MTKSGDETFKGHTSGHPSTGSSCSVCFNSALKRSASHVTPLSRCEVGTWPVKQHGWRRQTESEQFGARRELAMTRPASCLTKHDVTSASDMSW